MFCFLSSFQGVAGDPGESGEDVSNQLPLAVYFMDLK